MLCCITNSHKFVHIWFTSHCAVSEWGVACWCVARRLTLGPGMERRLWKSWAERRHLCTPALTREVELEDQPLGATPRPKASIKINMLGTWHINKRFYTCISKSHAVPETDLYHTKSNTCIIHNVSPPNQGVHLIENHSCVAKHSVLVCLHGQENSAQDSIFSLYATKCSKDPASSCGFH